MDSFHDQVIAMLPKLRVQASALTRNRTAAEDLVQETVCKALVGRDSFIPGTNFGAWLHRILRNQFISNLRRQRETEDIDDVPASALSTPATHDDGVVLGELREAIAALPLEQREALALVVAHGMSYEQIGEITSCAVGTAKSRVFRARRTLESALIGREANQTFDERVLHDPNGTKRINRLFC